MRENLKNLAFSLFQQKIDDWMCNVPERLFVPNVLRDMAAKHISSERRNLLIRQITF